MMPPLRGGVIRAPIDQPPFVNSPWKRRYSHKDIPRLDVTTDADRARLLNPKCKFKAEVDAFRAFRRVLKLLDDTGFDWVHSYSGPDLGIDVDREHLPSIELIEKTLVKIKPGEKRAPMRGLRAVLVYKNYQRIRAKVVVKAKGELGCKVRVKCKGPVLKADWYTFERRVKKRFEVRL